MPAHHNGRPVRRDEEPDYDHDWIVDRQNHIGLGGALRLAAYIGPDGQRSYWLIDNSRPTERLGCACPSCAPHEQLGPPPTRYSSRPAAPTPQTSRSRPCGRTTLEGHPCQNRIRGGRPCHWHEDQP